jgi:hypothetical protein
MPERPVPRESPTVTSGMPAEKQMLAISYMAAMRAPQPGDAAPDDAFAKELLGRLAPIVTSFGGASGSGASMASGGREINLLLAKGCEAEAPFRIVAQRGATSLDALLSHGILVVRCNDTRVQCLQSTRDKTDVLCTTAPRKK